MELKRILAKDLRRATEKAVKLYGDGVLFVSNAKINGQHEVIVAVDVLPEPDSWLDGARSAAGAERFQRALSDSMRTPELGERAANADHDDATPYLPYAPAKPVRSAAPVHDASDHRDYIRSREIVNIVRDELAAIRKEFKLAQRVATWQSESGTKRAVMPLVAALAEAAIPVSLRTLLVEHVSDMDDLGAAMEALQAHLVRNIGEHWAKLPQRGVHAITGPAGAGKTTMIARLARAAAERKGAESVAVISYCDQRAGAWSQVQMLCAQAGVDCLRANDAETLTLLLAELGQRQLVLIDTPGLEVAERIAQIRVCASEAAYHLVLPADAAGATVRKYLLDAGAQWHSLMVSRMDEATQPWALIQTLCEKPVPLSAAGHGPSATDGCQVLTALELATLAMRGLGLEPPQPHTEPDDDEPDQSVVTAAQALVARIEKNAHAS